MLEVFRLQNLLIISLKEKRMIIGFISLLILKLKSGKESGVNLRKVGNWMLVMMGSFLLLVNGKDAKEEKVIKQNCHNQKSRVPNKQKVITKLKQNDFIIIEKFNIYKSSVFR